MAFATEVAINNFVCDVVTVHCCVAKEAVDLSSTHCFTADWQYEAVK